MAVAIHNSSPVTSWDCKVSIGCSLNSVIIFFFTYCFFAYYILEKNAYSDAAIVIVTKITKYILFTFEVLRGIVIDNV